MVVVDSSVWIAFFRGLPTREVDYVEHLLGRRIILLGDLVLAEVLQGFRDERQFRQARELLQRLYFAKMVGWDVACQSAQNYRRLRADGVTVRKTIDVIIATFCVNHHHLLLHADRDFDRMREPLGLITL